MINLVGVLLPLLLQDPYTLKKEHPRIFCGTPAALLKRCQGPLAEDYAVVKETVGKVTGSSVHSESPTRTSVAFTRPTTSPG